MVWRGYQTSKDVYHLEWDAPYDPTGILPKPRGYIVYSDNFQKGRGEQWIAIERIDGSEEWGNEWYMDVNHDMSTAGFKDDYGADQTRDGAGGRGSATSGDASTQQHVCTPAPMKKDDGTIDLGYEELAFPPIELLRSAF